MQTGESALVNLIKAIRSIDSPTLPRTRMRQGGHGSTWPVTGAGRVARAPTGIVMIDGSSTGGILPATRLFAARLAESGAVRCGSNCINHAAH